MKRVGEQVNKNNAQSYRAFTIIAYEIPNQNNEKDILIFFDILEGKKNIEAALSLCKSSSVLSEYCKKHNQELWKICSNWVLCWKCDRHLRK